MPAPDKACFQRLDADGSPTGEPLFVKFNPTEFTLNKGAQFAEVAMPGLDSPILQFVRGQTETLTLDLFFDSTETSGTGKGATSVTDDSDRFYELVKIDSNTHAPPVCLFSWGAESFPGKREFPAGSQQRYGFKCVVDSVRQRYTMFSPEGVPLRAVLTVSLREYKTLDDQGAKTKPGSADHTHVHAVRQGDRLNRIADRVYGDPARWRLIAEQNQIDDPLALAPGALLDIPPAA